jgi:hypothetical protein
MDTVLSSAFDSVLNLDQAVASYFSGQMSIDELSGSLDAMLASVESAIDGGAFDKFAEVIEKLGLQTKETGEVIEDTIDRLSNVEYRQSSWGIRHTINQLSPALQVQGIEYEWGSLVRSFGLAYESSHQIIEQMREIFRDQKVTYNEMSGSWNDFNKMLADGTIDADVYNTLMNYIIDAHRDLINSEEELARVRESSADSIEKLINDMTFGGLSGGPQSIEQFEQRFADLYGSAMNLTGAEQTEAVGSLLSFMPDYLNFAQTYGGYDELRTDMITLFQALKEDVSGAQDYHIHIEIDGKEIAHVVATQFREGNPELISAVEN